MKALVTGASGFMGSAVVRELLRDGQEVKAFVRQESDIRNLDGLDVEIVTGDITDVASVCRAMRGCSTVFHLAAMVYFWVPRKDRPRFYEENVDGTRNVLTAARDASIDKLVYTSTVSTIGSHGKNNPAKEEFSFNLWDKSMDYERSKYSAEFEVWRFAARGLPVIALLPSAPVGPRDIKPNPIGKLILDFLAQRLPGYIDGGANFIDVDDIAYGHVIAAKRGQPGERYLLCGENISTLDLFKALESISGISAPRFKLPYSGALTLGYLLEFVSNYVTNKHPLLTVPLVKFSSTYYYVDCSKAKRELDFQPRSNIRAAAIKAIQWFLDNGYVSGSDKHRRRIRNHLDNFNEKAFNAAPTAI